MHLRLRAVAGHFAGKTRFPGQRGADDGVRVFIAELERHPVADGGQVRIAGGLMPDAAAEHDVDFLAVFEERAEVDGRLADQARRHPAFRAVGREGGFKIRIPAEFLEGHPPPSLARDAPLSIPAFPGGRLRAIVL